MALDPTVSVEVGSAPASLLLSLRLWHSVRRGWKCELLFWLQYLELSLDIEYQHMLSAVHRVGAMAARSLWVGVLVALGDQQCPADGCSSGFLLPEGFEFVRSWGLHEHAIDTKSVHSETDSASPANSSTHNHLRILLHSSLTRETTSLDWSELCEVRFAAKSDASCGNRSCMQ